VSFTLPAAITPTVLQPATVNNGTAHLAGHVSTAPACNFYKDSAGANWAGGESVAAIRIHATFRIA
jgi:hypothetical protein